MNMIFILISGRAGAGKSTLARELAKYFGEGSHVCSFATVPKMKFCRKYGVDFDRLQSDRDYKEAHRAELISYAEGKKKKYGADIWARELTLHIDLNVKYAIVDDLRFTAEYEHVLETGHRILHIRCVGDDTNQPSVNSYTENSLSPQIIPDIVFKNTYKQINNQDIKNMLSGYI